MQESNFGQRNQRCKKHRARTFDTFHADSRSVAFLPAPPVLASGTPKQSEKLHLHHVLGEQHFTFMSVFSFGEQPPLCCRCLTLHGTRQPQLGGQGPPEGWQLIWEVPLKWEDGSETWEPLSAVAKDDPVHLAKHAVDKDLLDLPGWK